MSKFAWAPADVTWTEPLEKYRPDQTRDAHGEFAEEGGGDSPAALSPDQRSAVEVYSGSGHATINRTLRSGRFSPGLGYEASDKPVVQAHIAHLDAAIAQSPQLTEPTTVYRGMRLPTRLVPKVGQTFTDKGFTSTSRSSDEISVFMMPSRGPLGQASLPAIATIELPKGTRALDVNKVATGHPDEQELLLARGSRFTVTDVKHIQHNGEKTIILNLRLAA